VAAVDADMEAEAEAEATEAVGAMVAADATAASVEVINDF
jgi:hypothetical protein